MAKSQNNNTKESQEDLKNKPKISKEEQDKLMEKFTKGFLKNLNSKAPSKEK